ncbi:MAG: hypothetical protein J0I47_03020 [Sphingomonas sp.]|uniref:hypothetical protein n=1 Tax=Sphingomonas sp. TaxID=28214 RepID=UPI001ACC4BCC|nr:hypothetical protein [Sphingomonas sp.]MBN8807198.1 hypothetical protein [Sphingomonas sp.]
MGILQLAAGLAGMTAANPSLGQDRPTGSMLQVRPVAIAPERLGEMQVEFGRCIYGSNPRAAAALLTHSDAFAADLKAARINDPRISFDTDRCLRQERRDDEPNLDVAITPLGVRAMLLEPAYLEAYRHPPVLAAGAVEALPRQFVSTGDQLVRARQLAVFADCVVFHDLTGADALVRTMPGTPSEVAAARALAPSLGACLAQGQRFSLAAKNVRAVVADGLWTRFVRATPAQ